MEREFFFFQMEHSRPLKYPLHVFLVFLSLTTLEACVGLRALSKDSTKNNTLANSKTVRAL